jgi:penicillin-binding protein 2
MPLLCHILEIDSNTIYNILERNKRNPFTPIKIQRDISSQIVAQIEEVKGLLPGIDIVVDSKRTYNMKCNMAHILGYPREINQQQLERMKYYRHGDLIGQSGLEQSYDGILYGQTGVKFIAKNNRGDIIENFQKKTKDIPARNGLSLNLTIDIELQEFVENLMANKRGVVVAIDPNNGEVLFCVSKPDFHPEIFSGKLSPEIYNSLVNDKSNPMLQRA